MVNQISPVDAAHSERSGVFRLTDRQRQELASKLPVALLFLPPALLVFTVFVMLPMGEAAWYSFYNWNGYGPPTEWVGYIIGG